MNKYSSFRSNICIIRNYELKLVDDYTSATGARVR